MHQRNLQDKGGNNEERRAYGITQTELQGKKHYYDRSRDHLILEKVPSGDNCRYDYRVKFTHKELGILRCRSCIHIFSLSSGEE